MTSLWRLKVTPACITSDWLIRVPQLPAAYVLMWHTCLGLSETELKWRLQGSRQPCSPRMNHKKAKHFLAIGARGSGSPLMFKSDMLHHQVWVWLAITSCLENLPLLTSGPLYHKWPCPPRCMTDRWATFATVHWVGSIQHTSRWTRPLVMSEVADFQNGL